MKQMGSEVHVHFTLAGTSCTARFPAENTLQDTGPAVFYIDMGKCHIFTGDSEKNLLLSAE